MIKFSAPGKIHLLGEHAVVYGKPAILATIDLRVNVTLSPTKGINPELYPSLITQDDNKKTHNDDVGKIQNIIEPIIKKHLKIKTIPPYQVNISSQFPIGVGLGSSAAISAAYIAALLTFLRVKWDLNLINNLTYEAEKVFHGNPSGGDNSTVIYGGLVWFTKQTGPQQLDFTIPVKMAKNFVITNTGKPTETTKQMIEIVKPKIGKILDKQEELVKQLLVALKENNEDQLIQIIRAGEKNLEYIGAASAFVKSIIRKIEKAGGAAKICGGGGKTKSTGVLLCYHPQSSIISNIAKSYQLNYFKTTLGVIGLKQD